MTKYLLPCTQCGEKAPIDVGQAGQTLRCSKCGTEVEVPTMRDIRQLRPAEDPASSEAKTATWSRRQGLLFASGLPLMIGALGVGLYLLWLRSGVDTSPPKDNLKTLAEAEIDRMPAEGLWALWQDYREHQLQRLDTPPHVANQQYAQRLLVLALIALGMSLIGLGGVVAAFLLKPAAASAAAPTRRRR